MSTAQSWKAIRCLGYMLKVTKTSMRKKQQLMQHSYYQPQEDKI